MTLRHHIILWALFIGLISAEGYNAQQQEDQSASWFAYPVLFRLPETRWGAGAFGTVQFALDRNDTISPPCQVQLGFAYTQNKQWVISAPFSFFRRQRSQILQGEAGYYDASYPFFGTGYKNSGDHSERYDVRHSQFRISFLQKLTKQWFAGARWWLDDYKIDQFPSGGLLDNSMVTGYLGSKTSSPGLVLLFDTRDNVFLARNGAYIELSWNSASAITGSEYSFDRYRVDARKYFPTSESSSIALQVFGDMVTGTVPFNHLASVGGAKRMRGYYEGHFRDNNMLMVQVEWRTRIWKGFGLAVFGHSALLSDQISNFSTRYTIAATGMGLRYAIDPARRVNLRLDFAVSTKSSLFYLTVGEAF